MSAFPLQKDNLKTGGKKHALHMEEALAHARRSPSQRGESIARIDPWTIRSEAGSQPTMYATPSCHCNKISCVYILECQTLNGKSQLCRPMSGATFKLFKITSPPSLV